MTAILFPFSALCLAAFFPGPAHADGLSGYAEFAGSLSETKSRTGGVEAESRANSFVQRYNLSLDRSLFPLLKITAGGRFDNTIADSTANGEGFSSEATQISPYATLTMGGAFVNASLGYSRNELTTSAGGLSATTDVLENYNWRVGLRPEGLPTLNLLFSRSNSFDKDKAVRNSTSDFYSLSSQYQPLANLNISYSGSFSDAEDLLGLQKNEALSNALRGDYSRQFLKNRVSLMTSATLSSQQSKASFGGSTGEVTTALARQAGFFAADTNPLLILSDFWTSTPNLIDGNRVAPIAAINLGVPPIIGGDTRPRNLGLNLSVVTVVNTIRVYVNQNLASIANQFAWAVYTSSDNVNWVLQPNVIQSVTFEAVFDPQTQQQVQRFVINFADLTTQFIKVVTSPLTQQLPVSGVDLNNILVTELEALLRTPVAGIPEQESSSLSGHLDTAVRAKLLDRPGLPSIMYDGSVSYNFSRPDSGTVSTSFFLNNGLTASHRFNKYLTGNARLAREDSEQQGQAHRSGLSYSAALQAVPLSTLRHSLIYSGRTESGGGKSSSANSVALTNSAQLYRGIGASLTGGLSFATSAEGVDSQSTYVTFGANVTPHRTLSLNAGLTETRSKSSGGGRAESSSFTRSGDLAATYNPISALFFFGSVGFTAQTNRETVISQNFGGGWSPFRDGALQLSMAYNESLSSAGDQKTRVFSTSLRWNIRPGWWLDTGYALLTTEETAATAQNETEASSITSSLRITF